MSHRVRGVLLNQDGGAQRGPHCEDVHGAGVGAAERHDHPRPGTLLSDQVDLQGHYYQTRLVASRLHLLTQSILSYTWSTTLNLNSINQINFVHPPGYQW